MTQTLPAPVLSFLKAVIPEIERDYLIGDLEEMYLKSVQSGKSRLRAIMWLWGAAFSLAISYLFSFIRHGRAREVDVNLAADRFRRQSRFDRGNDGKSSLFDRFIQYLQYGIQRLRQQPAFSAIVIAILAVGIGANIAIFSLVNAVLLRPLPYSEPSELVSLNHVYGGSNLRSVVSARGFQEYRDTIHSFEKVAASTGWVTNLTGLGDPERLFGGRISWNYFDVYGAEPAIGRTFSQDEDVFGNSHVVILSNEFWKNRLGSDPDAIGQTIQLNGESYTIVGLMPGGFRDFMGTTRLLWTPLALTPDQLENRSIILEFLTVVARINDGVTLESAQAEMAVKSEVMYQEITELIPEGWMCQVTSLTELAREDYRSSLLLLLAAVGIVLALTCANVANMLLARSIRRRKEIAVRSALGAGRLRLIGMLLTESMVLSGLGGLAGLFLTFLGVEAMIVLGPPEFGTATIVIDTTVLGFTLVITLLTGVLFGLAPAAQVSRLDIQGTLREGGLSSRVDRSGSRLRQILVAAEFAMALIILTSAGLLIRTIDSLQQIDPGFEPRNVLTARISIPESRYTDEAKITAFYDELLAGLAEVPNIESVATTTQVPFTGQGYTTIFNVEGYVIDDDHPRPWGDVRIVSPGFLGALGLPLLKGRFFEATDGAESLPVIVVDEVAAERLWPGSDPIGKRAFGDPDDPDSRWFQVIGVVGHVHQQNLVEDTHLQAYFCSRQIPGINANMVIRTTGDPLDMVPALRTTVLSIDSDQPIAGINTMEDLIAGSIGDRRTTMFLLVIFAIIAIVLAALGIYGVMSQMVGERSREIGVRMACGASVTGLIQMIVKQGLKLAIYGTAVGLLGALLLAGAIRSQLYEISPFDPITLISVTTLILLTAVLSILLPAIRASRLDPLACLRSE